MNNIIFSLVDDTHRLGTELSPEELAAIGYVTVSWAQLEHLILDTTRGTATSAGLAVPEDSTALSLKKRLRALRKLVKEVVSEEVERARMIGLLDEIGSIEQSRNEITHGLWDWDPRDADKLKASSYREPYDFERPFDFEKLWKLGDRVGNINFRLAFPGGKEQAQAYLVESMMARGGHISRLGMQMLTGKKAFPALDDETED